MNIELLKGKIHRATVVQAELDYVGSITVDEALLEASGILEYEKVQIVVLSSSKKRYENIMSLEAGEYSENTESIPYMVTQAELPTKKNLKGVKQFDKE